MDFIGAREEHNQASQSNFRRQSPIELPTTSTAGFIGQTGRRRGSTNIASRKTKALRRCRMHNAQCTDRRIKGFRRSEQELRGAAMVENDGATVTPFLAI